MKKKQIDETEVPECFEGRDADEIFGNDFLDCMRDLTPEEKAVADYIYDMFIACGAEPKNVFYYTLPKSVTILYKNSKGEVRFTAYSGKLTGGYLWLDNITSEAGIHGRDGRYGTWRFHNIDDLKILKRSLIPLRIEYATFFEDLYNNVYFKYRRE